MKKSLLYLIALLIAGYCHAETPVKEATCIVKEVPLANDKQVDKSPEQVCHQREQTRSLRGYVWEKQQQSVNAILTLLHEHDIKFIDLDFTDLLGNLRTYTITARMAEGAFKRGISFDGSSITGYTRLAESDLRLLPDPTTFTLLPWTLNDNKMRTVSMICDIYDHTGNPYAMSPRSVLKRMSKLAGENGLAFNISPELEFFIVRKNSENACVKSNLADKQGYCDNIVQHDIARLKLEFLNTLDEMGFKPEKTHHEVAHGQHEITFRYDEALRTADKIVMTKKAMRHIAYQRGFEIVFMPKPIAEQNGSGMHLNYSLWDSHNNINLFFDETDDMLLSKAARQFIAGNLEHIRSLSAVLNPTVNSYKRLIPGYEAPVYVAWGKRNRSALIRIPDVPVDDASSVRAELRSADAMANPYLAFAALFATGIDGIKHKRQLVEPIRANLFRCSAQERSQMAVAELPATLHQAIETMKVSELLEKTIGSELFDKYIELKEKEAAEFARVITDWEMKQYLKS